MRQLLNDPIIKNAKPAAKTQKLSDGGGLFLYVEPNGSKRWRYRYQFDGKEQLLSLGTIAPKFITRNSITGHI